MRKLVLIAPAFLLMACGGAEAIEDTVNETTETIENTVTDVIEEVPAVEITSSLSSQEEITAFLEEKSWENQEPDANGMHIIVDNEGEGDARPTLADEVTIFYAGYLLDGFKFDGTTTFPATFPLMNLIQGWQLGIPAFGKGGKGKLIIPSDLAYGDYDMGEIPGGSTLLFEIELIDWQPAGR